MANLLFSFQGRLNRAPFWLVHLGILVAEIVLLSVLGAGAAIMSGNYEAAAGSMGGLSSVVLGVFFLAVFWISLAISVKRWHDRNKSAWWLLIVLVPVVGSLWYFIECGFLRGTIGPNNYG